jgi:hypothetical protein
MTSFSPVNPGDLQRAIARLKGRNPGQKSLTNYFLQPLDRVANLRMLESEKSLCFSHDEWDFARFYCYSFDPSELARDLEELRWPPLVVTDWISRTGIDAMEESLAKLDLHLHATYDRIVCKKFRSEHTNADIRFAGSADRDTIHALLFRVFDKYADHIMPIEELGEMITQEQVILSHNPQGAIDGFVILPILGQSCNFNFLYNSGGPLSLSSLLGNFYGLLNERGVHAGFSWVRRTRPLVLKLHESFGWKKDGLVNRIYLRS